MSAALRLPPYAALTPDEVLDALQSVGLHGDGRLLQLNSYENRVFQVMLEDGGAVVAKFYRPGRWSDEQILEEHGFALQAQAAEVPVVAPQALGAEGAQPRVLGHARSLALWRNDHRFSVSPRHAGRAPDVDDLAVLERLGGFLGRLHAVGASEAFVHRRSLAGHADALQALELLEQASAVPQTHRARWRDTGAAAAQAIGEAFARVGPLPSIRLHGDCHLGNLLWRDEGVHVVDLDDACNGPAVQDLWMLLSGDAHAQARQRGALLSGYERFLDFDDRQWALIEPLRTLRMLRHNAWIAQRWADPAFPLAFAGFETEAWWAQQCELLQEQLGAMAQA